jgi:signal transduction histidine kinase
MPKGPWNDLNRPSDPRSVIRNFKKPSERKFRTTTRCLSASFPGSPTPVHRVQASPPFWFALLVLVFTTVEFLAWRFDLEFIRRPLPVFPAIFPWTIVGFFGISFVLLLLSTGLKPLGVECQGVAKGLAVIIALFASTFLVEYLVAIPLSSFDQLLFKPILFKASGSFPGRPAPQTCATFVLLSVAVLVFHRQDKRRIEIFQIIVTLAMFLPALAVLGYLLFATAFLRLGGSPTTEMAIPTLVLFCFSGVAFFSFFPKEGLVGLVTRNDLAGKTLRRLIPCMALILLVSGWALYYVTMRWQWDLRISISFYMLVPIGLLIALSLKLGSLIRGHEAGQRAVALERDGQIELQAALLTERKRAQQALSDKNIELKAAAEAKDRFLASMSHELRTPLNSILGFTGTLLMRLPGPLNSGQQKQLETIKASAKHQLSLINDLLDLAKIESGKVELNLEWVACRGVLEEIMQTLRPLAAGKGLNFNLQLPNEDEVVLRTDRRALSQILNNLINNAIKFTDQGAVELSLRKTDDTVEIVVTDTGIGIKPEDQAKLFAAFTRLDGRISPRTEGAGLGLHLSQKLAALLGGRIQFESVPGKGSMFSLAIPQRDRERKVDFGSD